MSSSIIHQAQHLQRELKPNWDGYGALPLDADVFEMMTGFLLLTLPAGFPDPDLIPGGDGSLAAEWHLADAEFTLNLSPREHAWYAWRGSRGGAEERDWFEADAKRALKEWVAARPIDVERGED